MQLICVRVSIMRRSAPRLNPIMAYLITSAKEVMVRWRVFGFLICLGTGWLKKKWNLIKFSLKVCIRSLYRWLTFGLYRSNIEITERSPETSPLIYGGWINGIFWLNLSSTTEPNPAEHICWPVGGEPLERSARSRYPSSFQFITWSCPSDY